MRILKLTITAFFLVFSAACAFISDNKFFIKTNENNPAKKNSRAFFTKHAQTLKKANPENVRGDFENENRLEYLGVKAEMKRIGDDFFVSFQTQEKLETFQIEAVIGEKKLEEYIVKKDEKLIRLPIAYDLIQKNWINLNAAFFEPDGKDFFRHQKDWNAECASCHLEKTSENIEVSDENNLDSASVLLACGSCHAKGLSDSFPHLDEIFSSENYSNQVIRAHQNAEQNSSHFFENGSVRLSSHEYQGILRSVCFVKNKGGEVINCLSCHTNQNGEIANVKNDEKLLSFEACTNCHQQFSSVETVAEHTKHPLGSESSNCYSCHLPEIAYGHLKFQRTHEISIPNPELTASKNIPNACNLCHLDKSVNWAIEKSKILWKERFQFAEISKDKQFNTAEGLRGLFAGDAFIRANTANALSQKSNPNWFTTFTAEAFQNEKYPLVRYFLAKALYKNEEYSKIDFLTPTKFELNTSNKQNHSTSIYLKLAAKRKSMEIIINE